MLMLAKHHKYINKKKGKISKRYCSTILADQGQTQSNIHYDFIELNALDVTGDENHGTFNYIMYIETDICVFIYDVTKQESFEHIFKWYDEISSIFQIKMTFLF